MSDFNQKLVLTLLDKGFLAVIVLFVGYWISRRLEVFRASQQRLSDLERDKSSLQNEIEKLKRTNDMEFREKQLSAFYWPIYFRFVKDSAIWKIIPQLSNAKNTIPDHLGREVEMDFLIKNHEEIVGILEGNIHLAGADEKLLETFAAYIRHVAVYKALRATKTYDLNPIDVGEPLPPKLIPMIQSRLQQLQAEYEALIRPASGPQKE